VNRSLIILVEAIALLSACAESPHYTASPRGPAVTLEHHIAEGHQPAATPSAAVPSDAGVTEPDASARVAEPPEPEPLALAAQWQYELAYNRGQVSVISVVARQFPRPVVTARKLGRFAIELWIGRELVDRVRFDFPLVGGDLDAPARPQAQPVPARSPAAPDRPVPSFAAGARVRIKVLIPASPRATKAVLVDRETRSTTLLPWPPDHPLPPPAETSPPAGSKP
jgi:hypothetical protein